MPTFSVNSLPKTTDNKPSNQPDDVTLRRQTISFAEFATIKGSNLAATDVIEAVKIAAGEYVLDVKTRIVSAAGAAMTCTVGDGADPDGFIATVALNAAAGTIVGSGGAYIFSTTPTGGKYYAAADTIDLVLAGTPSNVGAVEVIVTVLNPAN